MKLEDQEWVINPNTGNKINMKKLLTEQRIAMAHIAANFPFFSSLLTNLKFVYTFQVNTQATDGVRLLVNPEFTAGLSIRMKAFVMMHECMHCALDHMARGKNHPISRSNAAADYEVNALLERSRGSDGNIIVTVDDLKPYLYNEKYTRPSVWSYEHIYADNPAAPKGETQKGGQQGSGQSGESGEGDDGQSGGQGKQDNKPKSPEYVDGWNKALEDYKNGKIKL